MVQCNTCHLWLSIHTDIVWTQFGDIVLLPVASQSLQSKGYILSPCSLLGINIDQLQHRIQFHSDWMILGHHIHKLK